MVPLPKGELHLQLLKTISDRMKSDLKFMADSKLCGWHVCGKCGLHVPEEYFVLYLIRRHCPKCQTPLQSHDAHVPRAHETHVTDLPVILGWPMITICPFCGKGNHSGNRATPPARIDAFANHLGPATPEWGCEHQYNTESAWKGYIHEFEGGTGYFELVQAPVLSPQNLAGPSANIQDPPPGGLF